MSADINQIGDLEKLGGNRAGGGLRGATWHYMNYGGNGEEIYEMSKDPHQYTNQYTNVVDDPAYSATLNEARTKFKARMAAAK